MLRLTYSTIALVLLCLQSYSQGVRVKSGPLLGYAEMREAQVWIQLDGAGEVYAKYDDLSTTKKETFKTDVVETNKFKAFTAKLNFDQIEPGRKYRYSIYVDGVEQKFSYPLEFETEPLWDYRTEPPTFTMALGSCAYINEEEYDRPGKPYGGDYQIFESIQSKSPNAMLWLGDNIYLRPADWGSRTGFIKRYNHTRSLAEMQELLASANHYAIWDDHDFGPNDASGSWMGKDLALEMFKLYWPNPSFGYADLPGTMSQFNYRDCDFILMDNRYYRTEQSDHAPEQIFGKVQIDRMIDLLKQSRAPFKFVATGGQFLNTAKNYENHACFEEERAYILKRLDQENLSGVVFLSGDRHHSEVMKMRLPESGNLVYEFTVSPLTSSAHRGVDEENETRIEGSMIKERNFAIMEISGPRKARTLNLRYFNSDGEEIYTFSLPEQK